MRIRKQCAVQPLGALVARKEPTMPTILLKITLFPRTRRRSDRIGFRSDRKLPRRFCTKVASLMGPSRRRVQGAA